MVYAGFDPARTSSQRQLPGCLLTAAPQTHQKRSVIDATPPDDPMPPDEENSQENAVLEAQTDVPALQPLRNPPPPEGGGDQLPARSPRVERSITRSREVVQALGLAEKALPRLLTNVVDHALDPEAGCSLRDKNAVLKTVADLTLVKERAARELGLTGSASKGGQGITINVKGNLDVEALRAMTAEQREAALVEAHKGEDGVYVPERDYGEP